VDNPRAEFPGAFGSMDSFEFNKIAGAVLGTGLFILLASTLSESIFHSEAPETPVYLASLATEDGGGDHGAAGGGEPHAEESIAMLMASADAGSGEKVAKKCAACHTFDNGGANKVGPNLWNIVNKPIASADGFSYSPAMTDFAAGGKLWDYEALDKFLAKPKAYISGTKMGFGGLSKGGDRADLIAYLRSLSDSPAPLPEGDSADAGSASKSGMTEETAAVQPAMETATDAAASAPMTAPAASESAPAASETAMATDAEKPADATQAAAESAPMATESPAAAEAPAADEAPKTEMAAASSEPATGGSDDANPVLAMIAGEDPADGEKVAKKCKACHAFEEGGKNKVGPPLWNIVNRPVASAEGFKFSEAMKAHAEGGTVWSYAELEAFLTKPKDHIKKTKMVFPGLRKDKDRAAILAYLRTLASEPAPLP
jgi:cytochrome c2